MQYIVNNTFTIRLHRFLQFLILSSVFIFSSTAQAWFDNNWPYRAHVVLTNSSGNNVTDHVFEINLSTVDLHPDYSWSAAGADIRVYDSNDSTPLDFFIEYWDQSAKTTSILLKTSLNNGQSKTAYLY